MPDSALGNAILNSAMTLLYIGGLFVLVAWLKKKDGPPSRSLLNKR
jgi:hypothetical protein